MDVGTVTAETLGDPAFRHDHGARYAYVVGSMYRGISSVEMVVNTAGAGILGFFGSGGLRPEQVEEAIGRIQAAVAPGAPYGVNLLRDEAHPEREERMIDLFLRRRVPCVEASAFMYVTAPLVRFRAAGLSRDGDGRVVAANRIMAKVSRPEVAEAFLSPAPEAMVRDLLGCGAITSAQADMLAQVPLADDLCVESDSGGHTDGACALAVFPSMRRMRDDAMWKFGYAKPIRVGAAGGIGTPEAVAGAFMLGADFVLTGSINQCTVEAGTSEAVKDLLVNADIQDTTYAPAGDLFETGAKVQVLRKGVLFPGRANKLYALYSRFASIEELDHGTRKEIEERFFRTSFDDVYGQIKDYYPPEFIREVEGNPKRKMALCFRWYMRQSTALAIKGVQERRLDYQVHCGPAMGAFNRWVKGSRLEGWRNRRVAAIGTLLMEEAADYLNQRMAALVGAGAR